MQFNLQTFESIGSTNEPIKAALEEGHPEGLVVRARKQTGGYGRQGRTWVSPLGGLYQSVLLRPSVPTPQLPTLGLITALAIRSALLEVCNADPQMLLVKWPNDVMYGDGKLVGISCEAHAGGVCVGVGVNVVRPLRETPVGGKNTPSYICDILPDVDCPQDECARCELIDVLGDAILEHLHDYYRRWSQSGFDAFVAEYTQANYLKDREVRLVLTSGQPLVQGRVSGVDGSGSILIDDGFEEKPFSSGEAHVLL